MRKLLSYVFIFLMFLNIMGYYWILAGMHYNSTQSLERKLSSDNYEETETVEIKIPISLPYVADNADFERTEGQFEYNGEYYHLVKQQYSNDTLRMICVKNHDSKQISQALRDYVQTFADQPGDAGKTLKEFSNFLKDYLIKDFSIEHIASGWSIPIQQFSFDQGIPASFQTEISQPPELV